MEREGSVVSMTEVKMDMVLKQGEGGNGKRRGAQTRKMADAQGGPRECQLDLQYHCTQLHQKLMISLSSEIRKASNESSKKNYSKLILTFYLYKKLGNST